MKKNYFRKKAYWLHTWTNKLADVEGHIGYEEAKSEPNNQTIAVLEEQRACLYNKLNQSVLWYAQAINQNV